MKLTPTQLRILEVAGLRGYPSDGVRVRGARVRPALQLDAMGLVRTADLTANGDGAQVRILPAGLAELKRRNLPPSAAVVRAGVESTTDDVLQQSSSSDSSATCPRCGRERCTVTWTRRGTPRLHAHRRPDGTPCRVSDTYLPPTPSTEA
jgi:hypothetical protein